MPKRRAVDVKVTKIDPDSPLSLWTFGIDGKVAADQFLTAHGASEAAFAAAMATGRRYLFICKGAGRFIFQNYAIAHGVRCEIARNGHPNRDKLRVIPLPESDEK
jgi:hypothetical protein